MVLLRIFNRERCLGLCSMLFVVLLAFGSPSAWVERRSDDVVAYATETHNTGPHSAIEWQTDYRQARGQAIEAHKNLLIYFSGPTDDPRSLRFIKQTCLDPEVHQLIRQYVCVRVLHDAKVRVDGREITLLTDPAFSALQKAPGLAVVDFSDPDRETYGHMIGGLPFSEPSYYAPQYESPVSVATFLKLPPGTLTERMLIYAIRIHPEGPRSTSGASSPVLCEAAAEHSRRQASLGRQGHQRWESRFHRIWSQVGGKPPVEVCAESWPDESLLTACLGCVHAWRQSAGHWRAVVGNPSFYGYDIRRGKNRIWYATGIFSG